MNIRLAVLRNPGPASRSLALALLLGAGTVFAAPQNLVRAEPGEGASGPYLAGIIAEKARDQGAAAEFFVEALQADPRNAALVDQAFFATLIDGNLPEAFRIAERTTGRDDPAALLGHIALSVRAFKRNDFSRARRNLDRAQRDIGGPDLTVALLRGWTHVGQKDYAKAVATLEKFNAPDFRVYRDFFTGLMADVLGRKADAEKHLAAAAAGDRRTMRIVEAHARFLSRAGRIPQAIETIEAWRKENPGQPFLDAPLARLQAGESLPPLVRNAAEGAAEVFYGLAAGGSSGRDAANAVIQMQFARFLSPGDEMIGMTLAEFFDQLRQNARAEELYATIPKASPFFRRAALGRALALERQEKSDEAIAVLRELVAVAPDEVEAADILGAILRSKKRWAESLEVYDAAIAGLPKIESEHWALYFGRAIAHERLKNWPKAEPDFQAALDLLPPRPRTPRERAQRAQVLNYLAYSWVDMKMHIEKSLDMLKEAVSMSPDDGAIIDSLGWAYYRLGRYEDAVRELERAILLKAGDPTINDHLGDAYWKVGRTREAYFKWRQTLELEPEPEDRAKTEEKLRSGLNEGPAAAAPARPNGG